MYNFRPLQSRLIVAPSQANSEASLGSQSAVNSPEQSIHNSGSEASLDGQLVDNLGLEAQIDGLDDTFSNSSQSQQSLDSQSSGNNMEDGDQDIANGQGDPAAVPGHQNRGAALRLPLPDNFFGKPEESFITWLQNFNRYCQLMQHSEIQRLSHLAYALKGDAKFYWSSLPLGSKETYALACASLVRRYSLSGSLKASKISSFWSRKQGPTMSAVDFFGSMKFDAIALEMDENVVIQVILNNLRPSCRTYAIAGNHATFDELYETLLDIPQEAEASVVSTENSTMIAAIEQLKTQIQGLQVQNVSLIDGINNTRGSSDSKGANNQQSGETYSRDYNNRNSTSPHRAGNRFTSQSPRRRVTFGEQSYNYSDRSSGYQSPGQNGHQVPYNRQDRPSRPANRGNQFKASRGYYDREHSQYHAHSNQSNNACTRCGRMHEYRNCPAYNAICRQCEKKGHYQSCCRSARPSY